MKFNITALALTAAAFWGAALLIVGLADLAFPGYGGAFLDLSASIYPGYHPRTGIGSVIVAVLYALVDGAIAGAVFGWFYNLMVRVMG
jgi:hypothetical protein